MFPFWEKVVAPALRAAGARRLVEIGALRGEQTQLILDTLGPEAELHVIDPVPAFDPDEHRRRFGDGYFFHRNLSVDILGDLPPMDAALVDGDHNWYTVFNELRLLSEVARAADAPLPLLVLHDVGWPYGRRDLYYSPDNVPAEFRQKWQQKGMRPGVERVVPSGGLNPTMANAVREGGPRNGVMTGLDDFIAGYDRPLRRVVLPIYFGLAIVVEEEQLDRQPALREFLDSLESPAGKDMLLELAESMRIDAMIFQHRIFFEKEATIETLADRYLDSIKRGLVDEYYLETEVRLTHLADCITRPRPVELPRLRDPQRHDVDALRNLRRQRRTGELPEDGSELPSGYAYAPAGRLGLDHLQSCLDTVRADYVLGDLVSCGEGRGGPTMLMRAYLDAHTQPMKDRQVWMAGRFRAASDERSMPNEADGLAGLRPDLNLVRDGFDRFGLLDERTHFLQGDLSATLPDAPIEKIAVLHLGPELGSTARVVLDQLYPLLSIDGFVVVDDASGEVGDAIESYRHDNAVTGQIHQLGVAGLSWRKVESVVAAPAPASTPGASRTPLARPATTTPCDLSVVVVLYNMAREAQRTLHALSRSYQEGVEDLDYEVIVVDNGSDPDQQLDAESVARFGPEFRLIELGGEATPSPAAALNRGIAESRGDMVALMVDGAHVVTPGVLRHAMTGLKAYEPSVVAVQQWYLGPGQQGEAMRAGYDQDHEDLLLENIAWPSDGYRLFEIGHFVGDRDWFDGMWESNCLFVPRKILEQAGGFDEGFDTAGGGYTNLDIYERLGATPGVEVVTLLGEGSFHQVHGGTTTNLSDPSERRARVFSYGERYSELRGRAYSGPEKLIHYVGSFHGDASRRTRARRMTAGAFEVDEKIEGADGPARRPVPIPDDLRDGFISAYFRSNAWRESKWLGYKTFNTPTDLLTYQDLVVELRPDWIIETGTKDGGRALFLASVCDLIGHGKVLSIDKEQGPDLPQHPRLTYLAGRAHEDEALEQVRAIVGDEPNALVILGSRLGRRRMHREFEGYSPFVPVGSYVVMEHTVLNGYPIHASHGPGPFEAVRRILNTRGDFVADTRRERHGLSFNLGGFLKRTS